jgi:hypothetical protein
MVEEMNRSNPQVERRKASRREGGGKASQLATLANCAGRSAAAFDERSVDRGA